MKSVFVCQTRLKLSWEVNESKPCRVHVDIWIRGSGGDSTGTRGCRLTWRALRGNALRFSPLLSRRHL